MQRVPCRLEGKEAQSRFHSSFDEAVILVDNVVEIFDLPELAGVGNGSFRLQFLG